MKLLFSVTLVGLLTASVCAQMVASVNGGDITIRGKSGGYRVLPDGQYRYTILAGENQPARVISKTQNIDLTCTGKLVVVTAPDPKEKGKTRVISANADQSVVFVRDTPITRIELTCTSATYRQVAGPVGTVTMQGATTIVTNDRKTKRLVTLTGSGGNATIDTEKKDNAALHLAHLDGPVKVVANVVLPTATQYTATGDVLDANNETTPGTITLAGRVKVVSVPLDPADGGKTVVEGLDRVVLTLDSAGNVTDVTGDGNPSKTTYQPPRKRGGTTR